MVSCPPFSNHSFRFFLNPFFWAFSFNTKIHFCLAEIKESVKQYNWWVLLKAQTVSEGGNVEMIAYYSRCNVRYILGVFLVFDIWVNEQYVYSEPFPYSA